ncbi:MAG: DinB family protein [Candidatus Eremiobacterota bacterium]
MDMPVFSKIHSAWHLFLQSLAGLPEEVVLKERAIGLWSVKDIIGHIASWEQEFIQATEEYLSDQRPRIFDLDWGKDGDAINARLAAAKAEMPLRQAWLELSETHRSFLAALANPEVLAEHDMVALAEEISWKHYNHHAAKVREYRKKAGFEDEAGFVFYVMRVDRWPDLANPEHWRNLEGSQEFIQCAVEPQAVELMANRIFAGLSDPALAVLVIDLAMFQPEAVKAGGRTTLTGHITGWFTLASVVDVRRMVRREQDGRWAFPWF